MAESTSQKRHATSSSSSCSSTLTWRCLVSLISTSLAQLSLFFIPYLVPDSSVLILLPLSAVILLGLAGVERCCKRRLRARASAPAFVFFNIMFVWGVYVGIVRQVVTPGVDFILNVEFLILLIGLCCMLLADPGYVTNKCSHATKLVENEVSICGPQPEMEDAGSNEMASEYALGQRVRYCTHSKAYVKGFDHHCPAFGNCIGQKNHVLFMMLLMGFITTEASFVACSLHFSTKDQIYDIYGPVPSLSRNLAVSTMLFALLQLPWQGIFLAWHIYCVCFNIKTDEWINWKRYPEFHVAISSEPGEIDGESGIRFRNPYDKGILQNLREFLTRKQQQMLLSY